MMDPRQIRALADEAAHKARREGREPYGFFDEADVGESLRKLPFIGHHVPRGFRLVDTLFVDTSGLGSEDEPALTLRAFRERIVRDVQDGNRYSYAITEVGQFQAYVGVYENGRERSRKPSKTRRMVDGEGRPRVPTLG